MAQSALTVTPPSPTPPTNFASTGATPPNVPNYTRQSYALPFGVTPPITNADANRQNPNPPPYFDDAAGGVGAGTLFRASTAALTSGTTAADNNTGTTAGTNAAGAGGTGFNSVLGTFIGAAAGAVPASSSVAHEGAGTEVVVTKTVGAATDYGLDPLKYGPLVAIPGVATSPVWAQGDPGGPMITASDLGSFTGVATVAGVSTSPNSTHASSLSPVTNPTLTTATPSTASGAGTATVTATGTGFTRQSVIWVNGIPYPTTYVSATSLTAVAPKKATAGTLPVNVVTGGVVTTASQNWTFT